nr:MAG TPA: hypothetical protein [Caudoviricetes sp.]
MASSHSFLTRRLIFNTMQKFKPRQPYSSCLLKKM